MVLFPARPVSPHAFWPFTCFIFSVATMLQSPNNSANSNASAVPERRKAVRYPFTAAAEVCEIKSRACISGRSSDLGRGGCFIDTLSPFPIGTLVELHLTLNQSSFATQARVVYSQNGMGMGLSFTTAEPDQLWILEKWLGELSGSMPPAPESPVAHDLSEYRESSAGNYAPEPAISPSSSDSDPRFVLNELIITLIRKRVLSDAEGKSLLQKLLG